MSDGEISKAMELKYMDKAVVDSEVSRYLIHPQLIDDGNDPIPIRWWRHVRGQFPNIYKMACVFWGHPSERLFSKANLVWDDLRSRLETENGSAQLFLQSFEYIRINFEYSNRVLSCS